MTRTLTRIFWLCTTRWRKRQSRADKHEAALAELEQRFERLETEMRWLRREFWAPPTAFGRPRLVPEDRN